jgi:L-lactate dehydrogenase complex protein LldG
VSARDQVLARIRDALAGTPRADLDVPRTYHGISATPPGDPALVDLLADRLEDYKAGVHRAAGSDLPAALARALAAGFARRETLAGRPARPRVVVPTGLDPTWLASADVDIVTDDALDTAHLDGCDAVVTGATVAVAETGTIILDGAPDQGRRALTLVPDVHVCVVHTHQIVAGVPDAMPRLDPTRPLTWISGPSATSDIELDRVEGVHGPRILEVVLVDQEPSPAR